MTYLNEISSNMNKMFSVNHILLTYFQLQVYNSMIYRERINRIYQTNIIITYILFISCNKRANIFTSSYPKIGNKKIRIKCLIPNTLNCIVSCLYTFWTDESVSPV